MRDERQALPEQFGCHIESSQLSFYDHDRQSYGHLPLTGKGKAEFMVGDYGEPEDRNYGVGKGGEFKIALIELQSGGSPMPGGWRNTRLHPHLEVFGDAGGSLRTAIEAGLLEQITEPVENRDEFSQRLASIGIRDKSEFPIGSPGPVCHCCGQPVDREKRLS